MVPSGGSTGFQFDVVVAARRIHAGIEAVSPDSLRNTGGRRLSGKNREATGNLRIEASTEPIHGQVDAGTPERKCPSNRETPNLT
jgi:hypothetical protein